MQTTNWGRVAWCLFLQVAYGDFAEEAGLQTSFLCPELTVRQLRRRRLSAAKNLAPESVGRVVPTLKHALPCQRLGAKRPGATSYLAYGDLLHDGEVGGWKRWKRASCSASSDRNGRRPLCETSQLRDGAACTTGRKTLKM